MRATKLYTAFWALLILASIDKDYNSSIYYVSLAIIALIIDVICEIAKKTTK